jgi:hypothetical protein
MVVTFLPGTFPLYDHGVLGAVNIVSHLESRNVQIDSVIREALIAIAFHNNPNVKNISLNEHPIAFLLILCDQLQDWNRVIIRNDKCLTELRYCRNEEVVSARLPSTGYNQE